jgi:heme-degrading monooxygenase HmoA
MPTSFGSSLSRRWRRSRTGRGVAIVTDTYASGNWTVMEGREVEFVARWTEWLEWTRDSITGLMRATLLRDDQNPRHFVSIGEWSDAASRATWQADPGFAERLGAVQALCDDATTANFERAASVET